MNEPQYPCKNCTKRHSKCHATCEEYIRDRDYNIERKRALRQDRSMITNSLYMMKVRDTFAYRK
jgi:predicted amidophosphoribosyltransferase